jgi:hypothetical protein
MINIPYKQVNEINLPERELTPEEKKTVIGVVSNGLEYVYYQKQDAKAYNDFLESLENENKNLD